jgi:hypothetical protein
MKNTFLTKDNYDILEQAIVYYVDETNIHTIDLKKAKTRNNMFCGLLAINGISTEASETTILLCDYLQGLFVEKESHRVDMNGKYRAYQKQTNKEILIEDAKYFYCKKENCIEEFNKLQKEFKSKHLKVSNLINFLKSKNPDELIEFLNYDCEYGEYYRYIELKNLDNEIKVTSEIKQI